MFGRDKVTESFGKESLGKPFKILLLVSSAHIPFRARNIARSYFLSGSLEAVTRSEFPLVIITDIVTKELGFFTKNNRSVNKTRKATSEFQAHLESETARAKLTYVREFHTYGGMNRIRRSKPDLIVDISNGSEVHDIVRAESQLGVLQIVRQEGKLIVRLTTSEQSVILKECPVGDDISRSESSLLLASVLELARDHKLNQ